MRGPISPFRFAFCTGCVLLAASAGLRAEPPALPDAFRARLEQGTADGTWAGVAVGMVRDGESASWFFGSRDGTGGKPLDADSRLQLGPLSQAYLGLLLADLAIGGKLRLDLPLREALPAASAVADARVASLSLSALAGDGHGLPTIPENLFPQDDDDPLAHYDAAALRLWLAHARPAVGHGGNLLGAGLLALAIEPQGGGGVSGMLRDRVLTPLQLTHTDASDADLVPGRRYGVTVGPWHYGAFAGAGGLRSTLADQLRFAQALLRPGDSPLRAALLLARQPREGGGLGWHVLRVQDAAQDWPLLWNGGSAGGHAAFFGFRVDRQQAVVVLGSAEADLSALGLALLSDAAVPGAPLRLRRPGAEAAREVAGLYRFGPDEELILRTTADGLVAQTRGQWAQPLWTWDVDAYAFAGEDAQITFQRNGAGRVESLVLHAGGVNRAAERLSRGAPVLPRVAVTPTAEALDACVGDFVLAEGAWLRLSRRGDALQWQVSGRAPRPLVPFAPDRHASGDGEFELRCERDREGRVTSVSLDLAGGSVQAPRVEWTRPGVETPDKAVSTRPTAKPAAVR